jgi:hypothetical protein
MFAFEYRSGIPILLVQGDVDVLNVDEFEAAVQKLEGLNDSVALISLERSPFVCVHAFGILLARGSRAAARGQRFILISPERSFHRKILRLLHFPYEVADSIEKAIGMVRRPGGTTAQI